MKGLQILLICIQPIWPTLVDSVFNKDLVTTKLTSPFMKYLGHIVCALYAHFYIMFTVYSFRNNTSSDHKKICLIHQSRSVFETDGVIT